MIETLEVEIRGKKYQLSKGMTLEEIAKEFQKYYKYPILLAKVNNKLEWVARMNNIKNRAEEIILNEIIYL